MATIIDELVALITLDPKNFTKGRAQVSADLKKTREEANATGKDLEAFGKHAAQSLSSLRNEAIGLFLAFQGASSLGQWLQNLITGDAATGRLAKNIGLATNELSAWQLAVRSVGGDAKDADSALTSMADAYQSYLLTGTTGHDADFKGLGVTLKDLENPAQALLKMAEAGERMNKTEFFARLKRIGIPESTINLLEKGRKGVEDLIEAKKRDGAASDEDARKAAELQAKLVELENKITALVRPAVYDFVDTLLKLADGFETGKIKGEDLNGLLVVIGVTAALAGAPFVALAAAIALVAMNIGWLHQKWKSFQDWYDNLSSETDVVFDPIRKALGLKTGAEARKDGTDILGNPISGGASGGSDPYAGLDIRGSMSQPYNMPGGGGYAGGAAVKPDGSYIEAELMKNGFTAAQARGIHAGIHAEGGGLGMAANGAFGIGQWRGARQKKLFAKYGKTPNIAEQMMFLISELKGGDRGGASVMASGTAEDALSNYIGGDDWGFMRPGAGRAGDMRRGLAFLGKNGYTRMARPRAANDAAGGNVSSSATTVGTINVYTAATDAEGIARDLPGAIGRRGLTTQANRGLK
jgi:hypothetical protein